MTLLRDVDLYLNEDDLPLEMPSEFLFRSCYISNFLTRRVRQLRLTREYRALLIQGCLETSPPKVSIAKNLIVPIEFNFSRYSALRPGDEHDFFIDMFLDGLERCDEQYQVPVVELKAAIEDFRNGEYRNEWIHQKKLLRPINLQASLLCALDSERFQLTLKLEKKGTLLKEVVLEGDTIAVKDKFGKVLFATPSALLS